MNVERRVRDHYSDDDLVAVVDRALRRAGIHGDDLRIDDLAGLDQLHAGFGAATHHLLDALDLVAGARVLDVGCGVGGPARMAAARGCDVSGIDLSAAFLAVARSLTERVGLRERIRFTVGSATHLPYDDGSHHRAMLNHAGMNIADKARLFAEVRRVLQPGGLFAVYEQMRLGDGPLAYPLPWADDESSSFVEHRHRYVELLEASGFSVEHDEDRTAANAAGGPPPPGALGPGDLFGPGFTERITNNITAAMEGTLGAVLIVARAA